MLTTLEIVKSRLGIDNFDTAEDALLNRFLRHASARFELECNRKFDRLENATDQFPADTSDLSVTRYPVESVSAFDVKTSERTGWERVADVDYLLKPGGVISLTGTLGANSQLLRVTYIGGYVLPGNTPAAGQLALPDDLEQACVEQVAFWYQRREQLGIVNFSGEGGTIKLPSNPDLLPQVVAVLKPYTRLSL